MHYGVTAASDGSKEQAELKQKQEKATTKARQEYEQRKEETIDKINDKSGVSNDYDEIVAKANATGVDSLTEYQKLIYNSLERDEKGNIKKSKSGNYKLDESKQENVTKWLGNKDNMKKLSPEDIIAARKQTEALESAQTTVANSNIAADVMFGDGQSDGSFTYTAEDGSTQRAQSMKKIIDSAGDDLPEYLKSVSWATSLTQAIKER